MNAKVIIGSNAGDEGKGLATDYYANQSISQGQRTLVVLNNGGPQRSHTVSLLDGTRHAFRHFGSGTFAGADTYISEFFIINPMIFVSEYLILQSFGCTPTIYIDKQCRITTPYEMYLNQMLEESRGYNKHGSCGMGIWETIRLYNEFQPNEYRWGQIVACNAHPLFKDGMLLNRKATFNMRLTNYREDQDITNHTFLNWSAILSDQDSIIINKYKEDLQFMIDHSIVCDAEIIKQYDDIIFENGQGLLLNDDPNNVHTTPSKTGLDNIRELERHFDFITAPIYVTRPYLTRHGADPLFKEDPMLNKMFDNTDQTNVPNMFQGKIRYGQMDERLLNRIKHDAFDRDYSILITHMDEYKIPEYMNDSLYDINTLYSIGKTRESILK